MINAGIPQSHAERIWVAMTAWQVHRARGSPGAEHRMVPQHGLLSLSDYSLTHIS